MPGDHASSSISDELVSIDASGQTHCHLLLSPCNKIRIELAAEADDAVEKPDSSSALDAGVCVALVARSVDGR
jgi:hypothetical protein